MLRSTTETVCIVTGQQVLLTTPYRGGRNKKDGREGKEHEQCAEPLQLTSALTPLQHSLSTPPTPSAPAPFRGCQCEMRYSSAAFSLYLVCSSALTHLSLSKPISLSLPTMPSTSGLAAGMAYVAVQ